MMTESRLNGRSPMSASQKARVVVLIPCHNEEITIGKVIQDFHRELPSATVYVFDNCSTDVTAAIGAQHGATVTKEPRKGKGFVVASMFERIDADVYVMIDGDDTYPVEHVHKLLAPILAEAADMTVGARLSQHTAKSFRPMHRFGNNLVHRLVNWLAHADLTDIMSGHRAFNRRVAQRIPVVSAGFEVETELTIQMLYYRLKIIEVAIPYRERPAGSESKLGTFRDGCGVLWKLFSLLIWLRYSSPSCQTSLPPSRRRLPRTT